MPYRGVYMLYRGVYISYRGVYMLYRGVYMLYRGVYMLYLDHNFAVVSIDRAYRSDDMVKISTASPIKGLL